jgi:hypothetical protein
LFIIFNVSLDIFTISVVPLSCILS